MDVKSQALYFIAIIIIQILYIKITILDIFAYVMLLFFSNNFREYKIYLTT
jgi:hypothetical protein